MSTFNFTMTSTLTKGGVTSNVFPQITFADTSIDLDSQKDVDVAAGATDAEISLDGITAKHLLIKVSATCSVKLNGTGNTAITLTPSADNPGALVVIGGNVTSLFVTNPGGAAIEVNLFLASS